MAAPGEFHSNLASEHSPTRSRRLKLAWGGLVIAVGWAVTRSLLPNGAVFLDLCLFFLNGLFVSIYGTMLWTARSPASVWNGFIVFGVLGISHFLWLLPASALVQFFVLPGSVRVEDASMYLATGVELGIAVLALCKTWRVIPWLVVGTCASVSLDIWSGAKIYLIWRPHELGWPCLPLHLGIAGALFTESIRSVRTLPDPPTRCKSCEYDLTGLAAGRCPECGRTLEPCGR